MTRSKYPRFQKGQIFINETTSDFWIGKILNGTMREYLIIINDTKQLWIRAFKKDDEKDYHIKDIRETNRTSRGSLLIEMNGINYRFISDVDENRAVRIEISDLFNEYI